VQVDYCDICSNVIRHKYKITIIDVTGLEQSNEYRKINTVNPLYRLQEAEKIVTNYIEKKEICKECRELYKLLGNMRAKEIAKLKKKFEQIMKLKSKPKGKGRKKSNGK